MLPMNSVWVEVLGLIAGAFLICAFLPQVIKVARTRSARDLSLLTFLLQSTGVVLWIVYGFITRSLALVVTNSLTMVIYLYNSDIFYPALSPCAGSD